MKKAVIYLFVLLSMFFFSFFFFFCFFVCFFFLLLSNRIFEMSMRIISLYRFQKDGK